MRYERSHGEGSGTDSDDEEDIIEHEEDIIEHEEVKQSNVFEETSTIRFDFSKGPEVIEEKKPLNLVVPFFFKPGLKAALIGICLVVMIYSSVLIAIFACRTRGIYK